MNSKTKIFLCLLAVVFMTLAIMELSFGLIPIGLTGSAIVFIQSLILGLILRLVALRTKSRFYIPFLVFPLLILISIFSFFIVNKIQSNVSTNRANKLIQAINRFHKSNHNYPARLDDLAGKQIKSIPSTGQGIGIRQFQYSTDTTSRYWLSYDSYLGVTYWFNSETERWHSDD